MSCLTIFPSSEVWVIKEKLGEKELYLNADVPSLRSKEDSSKQALP